MDLNEQEEVKKLANAALTKINNGEGFEIVGQEDEQAENMMGD